MYLGYATKLIHALHDCIYVQLRNTWRRYLIIDEMNNETVRAEGHERVIVKMEQIHSPQTGRQTSQYKFLDYST